MKVMNYPHVVSGEDISHLPCIIPAGKDQNKRNQFILLYLPEQVEEAGLLAARYIPFRNVKVIARCVVAPREGMQTVFQTYLKRELSHAD